MKRNNEPIELVPVRNVVSTGIEMEALLPGLVPLFEEREAAIYGHSSWREWGTLDAEERAEGVAQYRMHFMIEQHHGDAMSTAMDRQRQQREQSQHRE